MYVRSKLHHISYDDAIQFAKDNGIRRADAIIKDVADSLRQYREIAKRNEVQDRWISSIESAIDGRECKFIIGKNKPEYATIQETGLSNLSKSMLMDLVAKYLLR